MISSCLKLDSRLLCLTKTRCFFTYLFFSRISRHSQLARYDSQQKKTPAFLMSQHMMMGVWLSDHKIESCMKTLLMLEITLSMLINILHTKSENNILAISWKIMGGATKWVIKTTSYHGCDAIMHFPLPEVCTFIKNAMRIIPPIWYRLPKFGPLAHGLYVIITFSINQFLYHD